MTAPAPNSVSRNLDNFFVTSDLLAASVDKTVFIATRHCILRNVREVHSVIGGSSAAVRLRKITDTSAPGAAAGSTVIELTASIGLETTINTVVSPAITATLAQRRFKPGDRIALDFSGTLTGLVGFIQLELEPV